MNNKLTLLNDYSNYTIASKNAKIYLGEKIKLLVSTRADKKYMVLDPTTNKYVHFGQMGYQDFTKQQNDEERRKRYLARATKIKGNWKDNKYSANNLAIHILWGAAI